MHTIADARQLTALTRRLQDLSATQSRVWGTMSAHQMVVHLGDGAEAVLGRRPFGAARRGGSRALKWVALALPLPWPRGIRSGADPASRVLSQEEFSADRDRAVRTLLELAAAPAGGLTDRHPIFGPMSHADWQRWAFLHTDHHLRQFGQ
jgi:hypothetical protein